MTLDRDTGFVLVGAAMLLGYAAHILGRKVGVPRVTLIILIGVVFGPSALDLVPADAAARFPLVAELALSLIGFIIGEEFIAKKDRHSRPVLLLALSVSLTTALLVTLATLAAGAPLPMALLLGGIATSTAPAATVDLMHERNARGPLTDTILGIVAADDLMGVLIFTLLSAGAAVVGGADLDQVPLLHTLWELGGSALLGVSLGLPMAWLTGRLRSGEPAVLEALGFVLVTAGLASLLEVSPLLSCMVLGGTVARLAEHHTRAVHEIEDISVPVLALFFLLAGYHLQLSALPALGAIGVAYIAARIVGRVAGSMTGPLVGMDAWHSRMLGWALLPQAGVALGFALIAGERFPAMASDIMSLVVAATAFFELIGPVAASIVLRRAKEVDG